VIAGSFLREESIWCQILGPMNVIDPNWEQTGWQKCWPEVECLVWWLVAVHSGVA